MAIASHLWIVIVIGRVNRKRLPLKQQRFVANYILFNGNGVKAVYAAGYEQGYNSAAVTASRLLRKAKVAEEIEQHAAKAKLSADQVIEELSNVAQVNVPLEGAQKLKALELLGKYHKLFTDRVESTDTTQADASKSAITAQIEAIASRDQISPHEAQAQLQAALSEKNRPGYVAALDPTLHPELWPQIDATQGEVS